MIIKISTLVLFLSCCVTAQDRGRDGGMMRFHPIVAALDANHDGVISSDELDRAPVALKALDKDGDGQVSRQEVRPNFGPGGPGGPGTEGGASADSLVSTLMAFDKNGDGKISKDELPERMQGMFDRGDADKDGFLSKQEIVNMAQSRTANTGRFEGRAREGREGGQPGGFRGPGGPGGRMRMDPVFAALDADHDGVLSAAELANAKTALLKLDRNGDGQLTAEELRPNFRRPGGAEGRPEQRQQQ